MKESVMFLERLKKKLPKVCVRFCSSDEHPSTNVHQREDLDGESWEVYLITQCESRSSHSVFVGACFYIIVGTKLSDKHT